MVTAVGQASTCLLGIHTRTHTGSSRGVRLRREWEGALFSHRPSCLCALLLPGLGVLLCWCGCVR